MNSRRGIALGFLLIASLLCVLFYPSIPKPDSPMGYFERAYFTQLGPMAISIELLFAGYFLFVKHTKTNFYLALFAFTALLDPFFNLTGLFTSQVPLYATVTFVVCALISLWLAFTNTFQLGRISLIATILSFALGTLIELFFNYW